MGRVLLASSQDVLESVQCLVHINWHQKCDGSVYIFPLEFNPDVYCCLHVDCDEAFGSEGVLKMVSILCREISDTEIIDHQTEKCFLAVMDP